MRGTRIVIGAAAAATLCAGSASAQTTVFSPTGGEQAYTVPPSISHVLVTATGAPGGGPASGLTGGRAAVVSALVPVERRQTLYVEVGTPGGEPVGGFNGGGDGAVGAGLGVWGGGGASDVRTLPRSDGALSLASRLIVGAGGGGSAAPAASGGDAGFPGGFIGDIAAAGGAGTLVAGGIGGCGLPGVGCGTDGGLGFGGAGGYSGSGADQRVGGGGGGGLYGGGGGGAAVNGGIGGGGGGSSLVPPGGTLDIAALSVAPSIVITPLRPNCHGEAMSAFARAFGGVAKAAAAFGVSVQQGHENVRASCGR